MPIYVGAYFCMGAYKCDVIAIIKMGAFIHGPFIHGPYFLWVPIIRILRYVLSHSNSIKVD